MRPLACLLGFVFLVVGCSDDGVGDKCLMTSDCKMGLVCDNPGRDGGVCKRKDDVTPVGDDGGPPDRPAREVAPGVTPPDAPVEAAPRDTGTAAEARPADVAPDRAPAPDAGPADVAAARDATAVDAPADASAPDVAEPDASVDAVSAAADAAADTAADPDAPAPDAVAIPDAGLPDVEGPDAVAGG